MNAAGAALIEAVAAVTVGGALAAAGAMGARDVLAELERIRASEHALTAARNLAEAARAAPCGRAETIAPCPPGLTCTLHRTTLVAATPAAPAVVHIHATAALDDPAAPAPSARVTLRTAARRPGSCR